MRVILKIFVVPFVLLLSLVLWVLTLLHALTTGVLNILALIAAACGLFACTIGGDPASGHPGADRGSAHFTLWTSRSVRMADPKAG